MKHLYSLLLFCTAIGLTNAQNIDWIKKGVGPYGLNKLESVTYANPDKLWAVGNNGYVLTSYDNGFTWEEDNTGSGDDLVDIAILPTTQNDPSNGYAVSKQGTVFHTHKALESWGSVSINAGSFEEPVAFHGIEYVLKDYVTQDYQLVAIGEGATKGLLLLDNGLISCTNCNQEMTVFKELDDIPRDIFFLSYYDSDEGGTVNLAYIVGDNGFAAYSDDYFETYTLLPNLGATEDLTSVVFKDGDTGYIGAEGALYYTNDGGASWTKQDTSPWNAVKITDIRYINSFAYATAVSLTDPSATFYAELTPTTSSFSFSINYINEGGLNQLTEKYMGIYPSVDGQNFVLISENGIIAESSDYGSTFTVQNTDIPSPNAIDVTGSRIYVSHGFYNTGSAYSEDNGDTWVPISFSGALTDYSIDEIAVKYNGTDYVGLAATALEPTYLFEDGEINSWLPGVEYDYQADGVIQDIDFDSDGNAWFVGNSSIYKASGANYAVHERIPTGSGYELGYNVDEYAVDFLDSQTGYITGPNGFLYKTTDGGANWTTLTASTSADFREIAFLNSDDGFVLFDASTDEYLYTQDGGDTWDTGILPAVTTWNEVLFINESIGFISSTGGFLAKTTDAGASWSLIDLEIDRNIVDISFNDEKLYGVIDGGFIFSIADIVPSLITWSGTEWSNGSGPTAIDDVTLNAPYITADHGEFEVNNLEVSSSSFLRVSSGHTLDVKKDVIVNGEMFVESGASLITYEGNALDDDIYFYRKTRYSDGKYSFVGSPVEQSSQTTASDLGTNVYTYDEAQSDDEEDLSRWIQANDTDQLEPGRGYTQAFQEDITFQGRPNTGTITYSGSYENDGWHLVSNPYAAAIFIDDFIDENDDDITGAIYIWDDNNSQSGRGSNSDYIVANKSGVTDNHGMDNESRWNSHIGSAQGFFVQLDGEAGDVIFTETMRRSNQNADGNFFRQTHHVKPLIRINLTNDQGLFKQALVGFNNEVSDDKLTSGYDASMFNIHSENAIYTFKDDTRLTIQTVTDQKMEVPVGLNIAESGTYQLNIATENYDGQLVYLKDELTGTVTNLTQGAYSFTSAQGQLLNRFRLLSSSAVLSLEQSNSKIYTFDKILHIETSGFQPANYQVYNLSGERIMQVLTSGTTEIDMHHVPNGVYIVSDGIESKKIILK
ncbi:MAG: YCF48-related protein [Cyclobacteriaceae bacterium]